MLSFFTWFIIILLTGWAAFPIAFQFFKRLPDQGYAFSKALGLLLWGYGFWMLASLRFLQNTASAMLMVFGLLIVLGYLMNRKEGFTHLWVWVKEHWRSLLAAELVFLAAFGLWAFIRSLNPEIVGTEKPMELAFINAILRSPTFPPADPWLSGYSISYYYFGYVMVAMLIKLSGVVSGVGFNLAVSLWFGLTAVTAYGLIFNLVALGNKNQGSKHEVRTDKLPYFSALLGPFFILIVSNLEGFLEMLHSRGIFWKQAADGTLQSSFWTWLNIMEIKLPPQLPFSWAPERPTGIWWWRASRVLQDWDLANRRQEVIDEFPFFSYLLADLHPHVLAMPFALLAVAIALALWLQIRDGYEGQDRLPIIAWFRKWLAGEKVTFSEMRLVARFGEGRLFIPVLALGGLAFLNTWDLPIYIALLCAIWIITEYRQTGWNFNLVFNFIGLAVVYGVLAVLFYLPFYFGFSSQAGGILPSMVFFTRGVHFWVMFAPLLVPVILFCFWFFKQNKKNISLGNGLQFASICVFGLWVFSYLLGWVGSQLSTWGSKLTMNAAPGLGGMLGASLMKLGSLYSNLQGSADGSSLVVNSLLLRLTAPGTWLTLFVLICFIWTGLGVYRKYTSPQPEQNNVSTPNHIHVFVLILMFIGAGLTLIPEFVYLRDQFGTRMNTIFKFYFQTWMLWGVSAAYAVIVMTKGLTKIKKTLFVSGISLILILSLAYPVWGLWTKTGNFNLNEMTLDGNAHIQKYHADEWAAMQWLNTAQQGVLIEAVGGSYSGFARFATQSGMPNVLGWPGHESQWRGGWYDVIGERENDIATLYKTNDWQEAESILTKYGVRYIVVGSYEDSAYRPQTAKFDSHLHVAYQNGSVIIYEVPLIPESGLPQ